MPGRHEQALGARRALVGGRALAAAGAAEAAGWTAARPGPRGVGRDHLRAEDRDPLGVPAARAGLRQRRDLLASAARLAAERGLAVRAADPPAAAGRRRGDRLVAGEPGRGERPGKKGGPKTGPNPTDRGKPGSKRHLVVDRGGIPLAATLSAANAHESTLFEPLIEAIPPLRRPPGRPGRPRVRPAKLHADKAYDIPRCRAYLRKRGIGCRIARKGIESSERLGRYRWVVERTLAWLARFRRLAVRYERLGDVHLACLDLACALICFRTASRA